MRNINGFNLDVCFFNKSFIEALNYLEIDGVVIKIEIVTVNYIKILLISTFNRHMKLGLSVIPMMD